MANTMTKINEQLPGFAAFTKRFGQLRHLIEAQGSAHHIMESIRRQERILIEQIPELQRTGSLLREANDLKKHVKKPNYAVDPSRFDELLTRAESAMAVQLDAVATLQARLNGLAGSYTRIIQLMSAKLLFWNATLDRWSVVVAELSN